VHNRPRLPRARTNSAALTNFFGACLQKKGGVEPRQHQATNPTELSAIERDHKKRADRDALTQRAKPFLYNYNSNVFGVDALAKLAFGRGIFKGQTLQALQSKGVTALKQSLLESDKKRSVYSERSDINYTEFDTPVLSEMANQRHLVSSDRSPTREDIVILLKNADEDMYNAQKLLHQSVETNNDLARATTRLKKLALQPNTTT
jgi:hypothetical protein